MDGDNQRMWVAQRTQKRLSSTRSCSYSLGHVEAITDTSSVRCGLNELQSRVDADKRIKAALKSATGPFRKDSPNE